MKKSREELERLEIGQMQTPLFEFLKSYNKNIPESFPHVSVAVLKKFKGEHPMLFKNGDLWSIDQHRKKLMDWLSGFNLNLIISDKVLPRPIPAASRSLGLPRQGIRRGNGENFIEKESAPPTSLLYFADSSPSQSVRGILRNHKKK